MPNRADYTNALIQAVAQRKLAERQPTNQLVDQMALPDASQPFTRQGPPPPVTDISGYELPPEIKPFVFDPLEPATDQDMLRGLGQPLDPEALPVEALTPKQEPAGIAQWVKDAIDNLLRKRPETEQEKLVESILRHTGDTNPQIYLAMPIEELREFHGQLVAAGTE